MSLAPRLDLRQAQSLVMTPQMQQAIKLLALSNLEVEAFLADEIERNPLLRAGAPEGEAPPATERPAEPEGADRLVRAGDAAADAPVEADWAGERFIHDSAADGGPVAGLGLDRLAGAMPEDGPDLDAFAAAAPSLHDHLLGQAGEVLAAADMALAAQIIDAIDEAGYLEAPLADIAERMGVADGEAARVLAAIQRFDPTGVGARDLAECLALQAREADRYDPAMAALIANLPMLAKGQIGPLRRLCGVDEEDFADMVRELRAYDPKPGLRYGGERVQAVVPDVLVRRVAGGWTVELNSATQPRVLVDRRYGATLAAQAGGKTGRQWVADALAQANWLAKALDQRARTIVRVATELVAQQEGFFLHGVSHLKPLTLARVADAIGLHESTVSRVTSNKYLHCERGLFELKWFFTSGVAGTDGEGVSAEAVKSAIARLIAEEGRNILSDDKLVDLLNAKGFDLARRTVAKYREALGLGSSIQRRRAKVLG